jgi:signal transduction histidine kinase
MLNNVILSILSEWSEEFNDSLTKGNTLSVALFSINKELLFANASIASLFKGEPYLSLLNPTFDKLLSLENSAPLIFDGFLTIGDYLSENTSILVQVYRKGNKLLVLGGVNTEQLLEQNKIMHQLNHEINNLQRQLLKEKHTLENTLTQLCEANSKLKELNTTKDKFFSIIAHDLKNPFNTLLGYSNLLIKNATKYTPEKIQKFALSMNIVSKQAFTLLENLLEWSRIQTGKLSPQLVKINPSDIIFEVKSLCDSMAKSKNINLITMIDGNKYILADEEMVKTIIRNLVTNALKFTHSQGTVVIETQTMESHVQFTVSDTGIGIEQVYIEKLFSIDCNLSKTGTDNEQGTGLGLILCKEFVEIQGGKIWVESKLGTGSDFKFTMPIYQNE